MFSFITLTNNAFHLIYPIEQFYSVFVLNDEFSGYSVVLHNFLLY